MQEVKEKEEEVFEIPDELKEEIINIMNDCPNIEKVGDKEYKVYNLRMYSLNRIMKLALNLCKDNPDDITDDRKMIFALCTDLDSGCEILSIILCNHLFTPDNVNKDDIDSVYTYNDKLIRYLKARILNSTVSPNQLAALILGAIKSIDLSQVFTMLVLVKQYMVSLTKTRTRAEEQLQSWQEVKSAMQQIP
jgi:hypothetical protein